MEKEKYFELQPIHGVVVDLPEKKLLLFEKERNSLRRSKIYLDMDKSSFNIDSFIKKLLSVRGKKKCSVKLKEKDIHSLCIAAKKIFSE